MMACRTEGHAQGASLLFAGVNYAVQVWPWIVTALCALVLLEPLDDPEMGYPLLMARLLPPGLLGLLAVTLLGAFMSTVDTHLNLGAAYVTNDIYKRFLNPRAGERHYVLVSRLAMMGILAASVAVALTIDSIGDAWKFVLSLTAGAGLVWILCWFWLRVNAWSEIAAMLSSGAVATTLIVMAPDMAYTTRLLWVVALSGVAWLGVTLLTSPEPDHVLVAFVERVRPGSLGWRALARRRAIPRDPYLARAVLDTLVGLVALFAANFGIGAIWLGRFGLGAVLLGLALAAGGLLVVRSGRPATPLAQR